MLVDLVGAQKETAGGSRTVKIGVAEDAEETRGVRTAFGKP